MTSVELPWSAGKPLIGVVHLGRLPGQEGADLDAVRAAALADVRALEEGGADAVLLENWQDQSPGPFVAPDTVAALAVVARGVVAAASLPVGLNVLPNDYRAGLAVAAVSGARFVWLDVFSDAVRTDYSYSDVPPFEVRVDRADVRAWRARLGLEERVALLASVHPKHYTLLEPSLPLVESAHLALREGADAVVLTGVATGSAPDPAQVARLKAALPPGATLIVGSGLAPENAHALLAASDGAIVGSSLRGPGFGPIDPARVRALVEVRRHLGDG